jgi:hypothetical protein
VKINVHSPEWVAVSGEVKGKLEELRTALEVGRNPHEDDLLTKGQIRALKWVLELPESDDDARSES